MQTLHIYEVAVGLLRQLLGLKGVFWCRVVEYLLRVEFQGRGTLHFHLTVWLITKGDVRDLAHSPKKNRSSDLGRFLQGFWSAMLTFMSGGAS